jgi:hypothetical protein
LAIALGAGHRRSVRQRAPSGSRGYARAFRVARRGSSLGRAVHSTAAGASTPRCSEPTSSGAAGFNSMVRPIPPSCAHLDLAEVERELIRKDCKVSAAAKVLGVPVHDLRLLTRARPRLMDAAFEAVERALDEAEAAVREAIESGDACQRIAAAGYLLRDTEAGRRRGWGRRRHPTG